MYSNQSVQYSTQHLFSNDKVNLHSLRQKAYNYRWATLDKDVIPLTAADPDFPVCERITAAMNKYVADGYFSYCPPEGLPQFREAIASWYDRHYDVPVQPDLVLPVNSAAYGLFVLAKAILGDGGNAIIPNPVDFLFRKSIQYAGGEVRTSAIRQGTAEFDMDDLATKVDANTKAIFICNPNNPLGLAPSAQHLEELTQFAIRHNLWIVSDEIWADISHTTPTTSIAARHLPQYDKRFIISGLSKNFGLAGLRIGYIICPSTAAYDKVLSASSHQSTAFGIPGISQAAGTAALTDCDDWLEAFKAHLRGMRTLTLDFINRMPFLAPVSPTATYLAFPEVTNSRLDAEEVVDFIHREARVALVPGGKDWFESESAGHLRICYATSEGILQEAFDRIAGVAGELYA